MYSNWKRFVLVATLSSYTVQCRGVGFSCEHSAFPTRVSIAWDHRSASQDALGRGWNEPIFDAAVRVSNASSVYAIASVSLIRNNLQCPYPEARARRDRDGACHLCEAGLMRCSQSDHPKTGALVPTHAAKDSGPQPAPTELAGVVPLGLDMPPTAQPRPMEQ